jgi:catechol 2,3-dioxygenase-like lactoylglutathione lyase family enzyme
MITRFDHVVIAVRDLDAAMQSYRRLGFDVRPGGRHVGLGTENALIRFGLEYLEFLSVYDQAEAIASGVFDQELLTLLNQREALLLGYALASTTIHQDAERFLAAGLLKRKPFAMQRIRPDGQQLHWYLFSPGDRPWCRPWPFLIEWGEPDTQRLLWEEPGAHVNGVTAWKQVALAVQNEEQTLAVYQHCLGLELRHRDHVARLGAHRVTFDISGATIDLLTPDGAGPVQETLAELGEGICEISLAIQDVDHTRTFFAQRGIACSLGSAGPETLFLEGEATLGVRIILTTEERE